MSIENKIVPAGERETDCDVGTSPQKPAKPQNPAKKIAIGVVGLLLVLVAFYAIADRVAPYTSRGAVSAYVARVAPRVAGQVTEVFVQDNAVVQAGERLFALDRRPFELAVRQAETNLIQATQGINASAAAIVASQAKVAQTRASLENVRAATGRTRTLAERGVAAAAQVDAANANLATAEAQLGAAEAELRSAEVQLGPLGVDNPQIQAAQLRLEQAQLDLAFSTVIAPRLGVVTNVSLTVGQYIGAGTAALTFIDAQGAWITADFRENQLAAIKPGDVVGVQFDASPGTIFSGKVDSVAWGIDPGRLTSGGLMQNTPETRWFEPARRMPVRIELDGGIKNWPRNVRIGGKLSVIVYASGSSHPVAWVAAGLHRVQSLLSYLY